MSFAGEGGVSMVYWIEGSLAYALIGPMDREQLFGAAKIIQQQLQVPSLADADARTDRDDREGRDLRPGRRRMSADGDASAGAVPVCDRSCAATARCAPARARENSRRRARA